MLVWFAWFNVTALTNVRGGIGPRGRPLMFASMAGVGVLALGVEPLIDGHPWLFAVGYVIARTAVWPLWWSGRRGAGAMRPLLWGPGVSALWLLTPLVPEHLRGTYAGLAHPAFIEHVLGLGHPYGDVWQSVRPQRLGTRSGQQHGAGAHRGEGRVRALRPRPGLDTHPARRHAAHHRDRRDERRHLLVCERGRHRDACRLPGGLTPMARTLPSAMS